MCKLVVLAIAVVVVIVKLVVVYVVILKDAKVMKDEVLHYVKYLTGGIGTEVPCVKQDGARLLTRQK